MPARKASLEIVAYASISAKMTLNWCERNSIHIIDSLVMMTVFSFLAGNCDNHLKNLSLAYSADYQSIRLAPAYDQVSTAIYEFDREMELRIGSMRLIDDIRREDFAQLGKSLKVSSRKMLEILDSMRDGLDTALK